jgi:hypothetical protein
LDWMTTTERTRTSLGNEIPPNFHLHPIAIWRITSWKWQTPACGQFWQGAPSAGRAFLVVERAWPGGPTPSAEEIKLPDIGLSAGRVGDDAHLAFLGLGIMQGVEPGPGMQF